jgi:hypothetical protein
MRTHLLSWVSLALFITLLIFAVTVQWRKELVQIGHFLWEQLERFDEYLRSFVTAKPSHAGGGSSKSLWQQLAADFHKWNNTPPKEKVVNRGPIGRKMRLQGEAIHISGGLGIGIAMIAGLWYGVKFFWEYILPTLFGWWGVGPVFLSFLILVIGWTIAKSYGGGHGGGGGGSHAPAKAHGDHAAGPAHPKPAKKAAGPAHSPAGGGDHGHGH